MGKYHKKLASSSSPATNRSRSESICRSYKSIQKGQKTKTSLNSISSFKLCQNGHNHYTRASRITKLNKKSKYERSKISEERSRNGCEKFDILKKELQRLSVQWSQDKKNSSKIKRDKKKKRIDYSVFLQLDQKIKQSSTKNVQQKSSKHQKDIEAKLKRSNSQYVKLLRLKKCEICKKKGQDQIKNIVYCSVCDDAYHRKCLSCPLTLSQAKNLDEWLCEECLQQFQSQQSSNCDVEISENKVNQSATFDQMFYINTGKVNPLIDLHKKEWTRRQNQCFKLQAFTPIQKKQLHWGNLLKALSSTGHIFSNCQVYINTKVVEFNRSVLHKPSVCQMLSCADERAFQQFLQLTEKGQAPPLSVQKCPIKGYMVRALSAIQPKTIICEYAGEVMTYRDSLKIHDNDSIFKLLQTGSSRTSLDIVPHKYANVSKYFLGINNDFHDNYKKVNVQALIFSYKGRNRVIFYTIKDVEKGDLLFIDYNSGIGNHYPTESFL